MSLLVRKINKAKWMQNDILSGEDVSADAITNDLKTQDNTLSTWKVENYKAIDDAVLAIVSAHQHLEAIDVVCMDPSPLKSNGIRLQSTSGITPVNDLMDQHIDICSLTYLTLGTVADHVVHALKDGKDKRYTRVMIKRLLTGAIEHGRLQMNDLHESLRAKL